MSGVAGGSAVLVPTVRARSHGQVGFAKLRIISSAQLAASRWRYIQPGYDTTLIKLGFGATRYTSNRALELNTVSIGLASLQLHALSAARA